MCGINGLVNCGSREVLARMTQVQAHRGPDDSGLWEQRFPDGSYVGLGSRRLAILDLSTSGHMPMANADRSVFITYNGEVYNFRELRGELETKGFRFASDTDTEVVLHLYEAEGPDCVKRLKGMFAFAICDLRSPAPTLFLARDHFGVKPFYYWYRGRQMAFASEIKALLEVPGLDAQLDPESLHQYLTFLWVPDPKTMFRGIYKLPAGHYALLRAGQLSITRYWDLTFPPRGHEFPQLGGSSDGQRRADWRLSQRGTGFLSDRSHDDERHAPAGAHLYHHLPADVSRGRDGDRRSARAGAAGAEVGLREPADRGRARRRLAAPATGLAHGRTRRRPGHHSRLPGLPRSSQAGHRAALGRGRR